MGAARVLLTRTAAKGAGFARALSELARQRGEPAPNVLYAPVHVPRTVAYTPELSAALQATAADQVAWVTFTSANAVRACTELWGEHFAHVLNAADARLACVGKATAAELERCGIEPDYIPHTQSAMGMLAGFPTGDRQQDEPDTVWVVEGQNARPTLREGLGALGFRVMRTVVYRMEPAAEADLAPGELGRDAARETLSREASAGQPVTDAVVATAPSLLQALAEGVPTDRFPSVVAIGQSTASAARSLGVPYVVADSPSAQDLASAAFSVVSPGA